MKKLLLLLTVMFAFITLTFANSKKIKTKKVINKELVRKELKTTHQDQKLEASVACAFIVYVRDWDGEKFGPTHEEVVIDWACIFRSIPYFN